MRARAWLTVALLVLLTVGMAYFLVAVGRPSPAAPGQPADIPSLTLSRAEFCQRPGLSDVPPDEGCGWKTVELAKLWKGPSEHGLADAWFRLRFHLDSVPAGPLAAYLVAFNRTGRLFVNGGLLRDLGAMQEPLPLNWNRSQYAVIPRAMLRSGDNEIVIQERAYGWDLGWLAPVRLGSQEELRPVFQRRVFWQNDLVRLLGPAPARSACSCWACGWAGAATRCISGSAASRCCGPPSAWTTTRCRRRCPHGCGSASSNRRRCCAAC